MNDEGRVIGVPTALESPVGVNAGIGFAVPSVIVQKVVPALIESGAYEHSWLGISGLSLNSELAEAMDLDADQRGVLVAQVVPGSPADEAGLQGSDRQVEIRGLPVSVGGDVIVEIDKQPVKKFDDLVTYLARNTDVGQLVRLTILRDGRKETLHVTLATRPRQEELQQVVKETTPSAWLGIQGLTVTPEIAKAMGLSANQTGVLVVQVVRRSPADEAGLLGGNQAVEINDQRIQLGGDVLVAMDGEPISGFADLGSRLAQTEPGQKVVFTILRAGNETTVEVVLGERPASLP